MFLPPADKTYAALMFNDLPAVTQSCLNINNKHQGQENNTNSLIEQDTRPLHHMENIPFEVLMNELYPVSGTPQPRASIPSIWSKRYLRSQRSEVTTVSSPRRGQGR